jgi:exosortase K
MSQGANMMLKTPDTIKQLVLQNGVFYIMAVLIALGLKYHYASAGSDELIWILAPTAGLVEHISGVSFEFEAQTGFVNRAHRIIIAPSCAGVNFLIIAFCMAVFCGIHLFRHAKFKLLCLIISGMSAYILTLGVNTLRIILSIYMYTVDIYGGWITPQRVHRLEGIVIYFFFLCLFYMIIKKGLHCHRLKRSGKQNRGISVRIPRSDYFRWACAGLIPLFWYGLITMGVPLVYTVLRGSGNRARFAEHAAMIFSGCLIVIAAVFLIQWGWQRIKKRMMCCT